MLSKEPLWQVVGAHRSARDDRRVLLLPDHVLGHWRCMERNTGRVLWQHDFDRPNTVVGVADGIVIATEYISVGLMSGTGHFDSYAFALETGKLLWTTHPTGACGAASAEHYWYPDRYDHRGGDAGARLVEDGSCFCWDGRVLDVASGAERYRMSEEDVKLRATRQPIELATALMRFGRRDSRGVQIAPGRWLTQKGNWRDGEFRLRTATDAGSEVWSFDPKRHHYEVHYPNFYAYRIAGRYVYVLASEPLAFEPPANSDAPDPPRSFHLLTIDLDHGQIQQDFHLGDRSWSDCRIEAIDRHGLVLSSTCPATADGSSEEALWYFGRQPDGPAISDSLASPV